MLCSHVTTCALFPLFTMKASLAIWKSTYCEGEPERCERLRLSRAQQPVAANLLPNGKLLSRPAAP